MGLNKLKDAAIPTHGSEGRLGSEGRRGCAGRLEHIDITVCRVSCERTGDSRRRKLVMMMMNTIGSRHCEVDRY